MIAIAKMIVKTAVGQKAASKRLRQAAERGDALALAAALAAGANIDAQKKMDAPPPCSPPTRATRRAFGC